MSILERGPHYPFCEQLEATLNLAIATLNRSSGYIVIQLSGLTSLATALLSELASSESEVNDFLSDIEDAVNSELPDFSNVDELLDILNSCSVIETDFRLKSVTDLISDITGTILDAVGDVFGALLDVVEALIEYPLAFAIWTFEKWIAKMGIPALVVNADSYLTCLEAICKRDISAQLDTLTDLLNDLWLSDAGEFNRYAFLGSIGLTSNQMLNVGDIIDGLNAGDASVSNSISAATGQITDAVNSIKGLI